MKELIVVIGMAILGVAIFSMIIGTSEDSLRSKSQGLMEQTVEAYTEE